MFQKVKRYYSAFLFNYLFVYLTKYYLSPTFFARFILGKYDNSYDPFAMNTFRGFSFPIFLVTQSQPFYFTL